MFVKLTAITLQSRYLKIEDIRAICPVVSCGVVHSEITMVSDGHMLIFEVTETPDVVSAAIKKIEYQYNESHR